MKLTRLAAANIKGSTFNETLSDLVLYHGKNECGKSTRIEALTLALCRCLPGVASRPADIYELLASGPEMSVMVEADNGEFAGASWSKGRKGVETAFEGTLEAPRLLFSTSEFLDLTPKERTKFLFSVLPPPDLRKVGPTAIISNLKNVKCEPHTEHHEAAIAEFSKVVQDSWQFSATGNMFKTAAAPSIQDWLGALVEDIANRTKEAKASAKTMRQTVLGTTALRQDAPALGPIEAAKKKAADAVTAAAQAETQALNELSTAERQVQEAKAVAATAVDVTEAREEITHLESCIAEAGKVEAAGEAPQTPKLTNNRPTDDKERAAMTEAGNKEQKLKRIVEDWQTTVKQISDKITAAVSQTCCPTCGHDISDKQKETVAKLTAELGTTAENLEAARIDYKAAEEKLADAIDARLAADQAIKEWDELAAKQTATHRESYAKWSLNDQNYRTAQSNINKWTSRIATLNRLIEGNTKAAEAVSALPLLVTASQEAAGRYTVAKEARAAAKVALDAVETQYRTALADAAAARNAQQATDQAEKIEAKAAIGQELRDYLDELLKECIKRSIGPLVDLANSLCGDILSAPLDFRDGEICMETPEGSHSHKTMSGSSKALAYAALSVGLAAQSPIRLVILDELSRLDASRQTLLVNRLGELIKDGRIDQAILASPSPVRGYVMPEGITFNQTEIK